MVTSTLVDALQRARASWRGQLALLGIGSLLLGLTLVGGTDAGDLQWRVPIGVVEAILLVAASIRMALVAEAGYDGDVADVAHDTLMAAPRLVAQAGLVALVPVAATWVGLQATSLMTALGLVMVPLAFAVAVLAAGPMLLATCAVVLGDRAWLPRSTWRALHGRHVRVAMVVLAGGVAAAMAAVPFVLVGFVVMALGGWLGILGAGLGAASAIPWLGCGALATWRAIGGTVDLAHGTSAEEADELSPNVAAAFGAATPGSAVAPAAPTSWMAGPAWDVAVEPGAVWGTWIRIDAPSVLGFRVEWHAGSPPELAFASEAGTWTRPGVLGASGEVLQASLPAGSTYVQVTSTSPTAQALTVALLVPPAVAA
jgi:hypothetical protein